MWADYDWSFSSQQQQQEEAPIIRLVEDVFARCSSWWPGQWSSTSEPIDQAQPASATPQPSLELRQQVAPAEAGNNQATRQLKLQICELSQQREDAKDQLKWYKNENRTLKAKVASQAKYVQMAEERGKEFEAHIALFEEYKKKHAMLDDSQGPYNNKSLLREALVQVRGSERQVQILQAEAAAAAAQHQAEIAKLKCQISELQAAMQQQAECLEWASACSSVEGLLTPQRSVDLSPRSTLSEDQITLCSDSQLPSSCGSSSFRRSQSAGSDVPAYGRVIYNASDMSAHDFAARLTAAELDNKVLKRMYDTQLQWRAKDKEAMEQLKSAHDAAAKAAAEQLSTAQDAAALKISKAEKAAATSQYQAQKAQQSTQQVQKALQQEIEKSQLLDCLLSHLRSVCSQLWTPEQCKQAPVLFQKQLGLDVSVIDGDILFHMPDGSHR